MGKKHELELYKLIKNSGLISEFGWITNKSCCAWIDYSDLDDFMGKAIEIFGYGMFDERGFNANMQADGVCIDLCEMLGDYLDIEVVFPREEYQH